jgi:hypothetical protein
VRIYVITLVIKGLQFYCYVARLLLHTLNNYALSSGYINWFHGYLTNRESCVRFPVLFSSPFVVLSGVPQGSVLGPLLFNISVDDLWEVTNYSSLQFADDLKVYRAIEASNYCFLLQSYIERVHEWCSTNLMKSNLSKIRVISVSRCVLAANLVCKFVDKFSNSCLSLTSLV